MTALRTREQLLAPAPRSKRWRQADKAALVMGIHMQIITIAEAIAAHKYLSREEINEWSVNYAKHGAVGLRVTTSGIRRAP